MDSRRIVYIASLIKKNILGEISLTEQEILQRWLDESPKNEELYQKYKEPDFLLSVDKEADLLESNIAYSKFMEKVRAKPKQAKFEMKRYLVAASLIAFVCGVSLLVYRTLDDSLRNQHSKVDNIANVYSQDKDIESADALLLIADGEAIPMKNSQELISVSQGSIRMGNQALMNETDEKTAQQTYSTLKILRGKKYKLRLSDGTMVWLNADSEITFPNHFDATNRTVSVKGELLFDVTEDKARPFVVQTQQGNIKVLGTVFNIHCYEKEMPATTLVKGKIEYSLGDKSVILHPGQQCRVSDNSLSVVNVDTYEYTSWIDEVIVFKDKKLEEIMNILSRLYDVTISYETPSLKKLPFTGAFKQYEHLNDIIQMIEECGLIRIERKDNELMIKKE